MSPKELRDAIREREERGELSDALVLAHQARDQFPANQAILVSLARIQNKLGQREEALANYRALLRTQDLPELILGSYLRVLLNLNRVDEAAAEALRWLPHTRPGKKLLGVLALIVLFVGRESETRAASFIASALSSLESRSQELFELCYHSVRYRFPEGFPLRFANSLNRFSANEAGTYATILRLWWDYEGPTQRVLHAYQHAEVHIPPACHEFWSDRCGLLVESGNKTQEPTHLDDPALWPILLFSGTNTERRHLSALRAELCDRVTDQHEIERTLRSAKTLAVVGNSSNELGKGNGPKIDQHELVIRFNRFDLTPPYDTDYGTRTTFVTRPPHYDPHHAASAAQAQGIVLAGPNTLGKPMEEIMVQELVNSGKPITLIPPGIYRRLFAQLGALPSSGIAMLEWLNELRGGLHGITVFGFSMIDQIGPDRASAHYFENAIPTPGHDWRAEYAYFSTLMKSGSK